MLGALLDQSRTPLEWTATLPMVSNTFSPWPPDGAVTVSARAQGCTDRVEIYGGDPETLVSQKSAGTE